ncbi:hypothetical protein RO3G_11477 [Rhizopus delemar RA 99-880]|uniref:Uncharacterized protein n=1 Tax=Rhizopus delemar (strain RA 99-880 / ATCC MYA-4621 / FGSC 9543 / NRRL 43880) TaxID=246409 RepID=I1CE86_RHIO9|nr:hypothetical protein RO3G_11477 [Rhizopus delemar RA 99-880]|eukprot:EIE86766.1 hypothetical protein RO3G_11477 [Rhizopus delemar RA 99-880]
MAQTVSVPTYWSYFSINNLLSSFPECYLHVLGKDLYGSHFIFHQLVPKTHPCSLLYIRNS